MTAPDDYPCDMGMHRELDDAAAEAILAGRPVPDGDLAPVAALVREARFLAREAPPAPSPALAAILAGDPVGAIVFSPAPPDRRTAAAGRPGLVERSRGLLPNPLARLLRNVAGAGLAAKITLGAGLAAASMTGAAAAGVLPGPVQDAVAGAVRAVTPFEFHGHGDADAESDGGGLVDAPGPPATGGTAPGGDTPAIHGDPATSAPEAPGGSPPTTRPGATPTTTTPPPGAGDPAAPPAVQPEPAPATPEPAPTTSEPAPTAPTPAPAPAEAPTADAPTPVDGENSQIPYEPPTTAPVPPETGRP